MDITAQLDSLLEEYHKDQHMVEVHNVEEWYRLNTQQLFRDISDNVFLRANEQLTVNTD